MPTQPPQQLSHSRYRQQSSAGRSAPPTAPGAPAASPDTRPAAESGHSGSGHTPAATAVPGMLPADAAATGGRVDRVQRHSRRRSRCKPHPWVAFPERRYAAPGAVSRSRWYTCHNYKTGRQRRVATGTNADPARATDIQSTSTVRAHRGGVKGDYTLKHYLVVENKRRKEKEENGTKNEWNKNCLKHGHTPFA